MIGSQHKKPAFFQETSPAVESALLPALPGSAKPVLINNGNTILMFPDKSSALEYSNKLFRKGVKEREVSAKQVMEIFSEFALILTPEDFDTLRKKQVEEYYQCKYMW